MRIMHLRSSGFFGGPERAILGQCKNLNKHELMCASFVRGEVANEFLNRCSREGISTVVIPESFTGDVRVIKRIKNTLRSHRIDILVSHDYKSNLFGYLATARSSTKLVAHFRGRTKEDLRVNFYNMIDNFMLRRMSRILVVSETPRDLLVALGVNREVIRVVPNAVEIDQHIDQKRAKDQVPGDEIRMVAAGRLSSEKGFDILLRALALLKAESPAHRLYIYGDGPEMARLRSQAADLNVAARVEFCGFIDDLLPIFREMDFLVLPSRSEGMPNVILEAWSQQLGVLATAVGGVPEMIESGHNGLLAKSEDPSDIAKKIQFALENPQKMADYGTNGFEKARNFYSFSAQADLLDEIYGEVLCGS